MQTAIEKAKKHGIGMVQLRNSNHYGIAGYYALLAAKEHMLGVSMTNSPAIMVPTFCAEALLGSNPIAFAMPAGKYPFLYDGATTVITRGKVELYQKTGKQLMDGWTVDETGKNEVRPDIILKNIREKTGGVFSMHKKDQGDTSQCFYAMDYGMFGDKREIENRMETLITEIHHAKKEKGQQRIYTAGEKEFEREKEYKKSGIRKVNDQAIALERKGTEVIHLELGRPDFDTPQYIKDAAIYAIQQGNVFYTQNAGILKLREAVAEKLEKQNHILYAPDEIIITAGLAEAVYDTLSVLLEAGDEVLVPDPVWMNYDNIPRIFDAVPVPYALKEEADPGISCKKPEGAFYLWVNIRQLGITDEEFSERLLRETHVAVVPGSVFGNQGKGYIRISYASSLAQLNEAVKRINDFITGEKRLQNERE